MGINKAELRLGERSFAWHCRQRLDGLKNWCAVGAFGANVVEDLRGIPWLTDKFADRGPLEGLSVGLAWARERATWAFVSTIDVPLIEIKLADLLREWSTRSCQIVMPVWRGHRYGLTALYKTEIAEKLRQLVDDGFRKVSDLPAHFETQFVGEAAFRAVDGDLGSFSRINTPEEYEAFLRAIDETNSIGTKPPKGGNDYPEPPNGRH